MDNSERASIALQSITAFSTLAIMFISIMIYTEIRIVTGPIEEYKQKINTSNNEIYWHRLEREYYEL